MLVALHDQMGVAAGVLNRVDEEVQRAGRPIDLHNEWARLRDGEGQGVRVDGVLDVSRVGANRRPVMGRDDVTLTRAVPPAARSTTQLRFEPDAPVAALAVIARLGA